MKIIKHHMKQTLLAEAGYTTGIFGKWHLGDEAEYQPEARGFDEVFIHGGGGIAARKSSGSRRRQTTTGRSTAVSPPRATG